MSLFSHGRGRWGGGGSMFLKAELYSTKMVNSTGEKPAKSHEFGV